MPTTSKKCVNEELVKAGVMIFADGLQPSRKGKRIRFANGGTRVIDGPFPETKELVAGIWIWQVASMDETVARARRCSCAMPGGDAELEIRPFYPVEDLGIEITPRMRVQEEWLRSALEKRSASTRIAHYSRCRR